MCLCSNHSRWGILWKMARARKRELTGESMLAGLYIIIYMLVLLVEKKGEIATEMEKSEQKKILIELTLFV